MTKAQAIKRLKTLGCTDITPSGRSLVWCVVPDSGKGLFDPRDLVAELEHALNITTEKENTMSQQTTTELTDANGLKQAYEAGTAWASNLKPGDTFIGASPVAMERYPDIITNRLERSVFLHAALDVLETMNLTANQQGVILSYAPRFQTTVK